ncbi:hypothetical protein [Mesorhizobium sp.]|uniref:hypothetical protein n=1 Tax=Mesorhizobium sp. TaxID=1871066 RepID=UPI00257ABC86|nr:hypothetical protein [Mesorhizobium sp.]
MFGQVRGGQRLADAIVADVGEVNQSSMMTATASRTYLSAPPWQKLAIVVDLSESDDEVIGIVNPSHAKV